MSIYWQHFTGQKCSPKLQTPEELLGYSDRYFEDYCIRNKDPAMLLKTIGVRHCTPDYRLINKCSERHSMHYILGGKGWSDDTPVSAGDVIYFKSNIPYNFSSNPADPCYYAWITFAGENCEQYLRYMGLVRRCQIYKTRHLSEICRTIYDLLYVSHPEYDVHLYFEAAFYRLLSLSVPEATNTEQNRNRTMEPRIQAAVKYISEHYNQSELRVRQVSDAIDISEKYFRILFKQETGLNMREFLNRTRVEAARQLLLNSNYTISEISDMVGFSDYRRFYDIFKKQTGTSPQSYKNQKFPKSGI